MSRVAVVSDSNSGIAQQEAKELGVYILPMPFFVNNETFFEDVDLTQEEFYNRLKEGCEISTSMPSIASVTELWDELLKEYDEIVHIPMSSGLSSSYETAAMLALDYDGKVFVVNNQRISVTQRQSVLDAKALAEKLDAFAKARTVKQAKSIMIDAMKNDFTNRFDDPEGKDMYLEMAYTHDLEAAEEFKKEVQAAFPGVEIVMNPLSLSVSCHIGPGTLAVACSKKIPELM